MFVGIAWHRTVSSGQPERLRNLARLAARCLVYGYPVWSAVPGDGEPVAGAGDGVDVLRGLGVGFDPVAQVADVGVWHRDAITGPRSGSTGAAGDI